MSPDLIQELETRMMAILCEARSALLRGRLLEAKRLGRDPSPEYSLRHLSIPEDPAPLDEEEAG